MINVVSCKRLGKPQTGRAQPLLVVCKDTNEASSTVAAARNLRRSTDPVIRNNVYINHNLTRAEARAAYEVRCQRRLSEQRRSQRLQSGSQPLQQQPSEASGQYDLTTGSSDTYNRQVDVTNILNVAAAEFRPTVTSSSTSSSVPGSTGGTVSGNNAQSQ